MDKMDLPFSQDPQKLKYYVKLLQIMSNIIECKAADLIPLIVLFRQLEWNNRVPRLSRCLCQHTVPQTTDKRAKSRCVQMFEQQ